MKCPGQDMQYWNAEAIFEINCPKCNHPVEFYKDDTNRKCNHCGNRFVNPKMDFGCAAYCQYAEQCIGTLPEEIAGAHDNLLKDKVAVEMKRYLKNDFHRIGQATRVARYAEAIGKIEGGNLAAILCASYLHNLGETGEPNRSESPHPIAQDILSRLNAKEPMTDAVYSLLSQINKNGETPSLESQILSDAKKLADMEEQCKQDNDIPTEKRAQIISGFVTTEGKQQADALLLKYKY